MSDKTEIKRLNVTHYGPLSDVDLEMEPGLNAFYGRNESGKTLLVEAVTKMLLDDTTNFEGIGRVSQKPNGLLTVEKDGKEFDASQEDLNDIFGDVTHEDIRNAFIVRDLDLRLPERENDFGNGDYFKDVTDRVLGSKTSKIEALRDEISDIGFLTNSTSNSKLENTKGTGKLRNKKEDSEELREKIDEFISKMESEGLFQKYSRIDEIESEIDSKENEINELENAKKQKKYDEGQSLLESLRKAERELDDLKREKKSLDDLEDIKKRAEKFERDAEKPGVLKWAAIGSSALSGLSLISAALNPSPVFIGGALAFLAAAGYSVYKYRDSSVNVQRQRKKEREIIEDAEAKGVEAETIPEVIDAVESYEDKLDREEKELNRNRSQTNGQLKGLFDSSADSTERWTSVLDNFSNTFESMDREFNEGDLEEAEKELNQLKDEKKELQNDIKEYNQLLDKLDSSISKLPIQKFLDEEPVNVESVEDLEKASIQLEKFINSIEDTVKASKNAIEILEEMEQEEEDEFNRIFNEDSYAVEMFSKATGGNYKDISYDKKSQKLEVERKDGRTIDPEGLSQGTYDLLYMAVRLKLAREILGGPGFLVLDNAFVHSDIERVERELEFLQELEDNGWQIIYFTFRDDVREKLEEITDVRELEGLEFAE